MGCGRVGSTLARSLEDRNHTVSIIDSDPDAAIVRAIITLGHALGLKVVAEGVETRAHHEFLRRHGCDELQGYYFSRPVPATEMEALLRNADAIQPVHSG